jgi:2-amino-4-hydroxy-6-hydroxymethyldihydropteridine diphosphokinase
MTRYAVALGSNLGDRIGHLRGAVEEIDGLGEDLKVSGLYETEPIGGPEQDPYLNAVVTLESTLSPDELLSSLQEIEWRHDRERSVVWGPRTLDLDIVTMAPGSVSTENLQIPHPRAAERRFVLEPLSEIWPEAPLGDGVYAAAALDSTKGQRVDHLARRWTSDSAGPDFYWVVVQFVLFGLLGLAIFAFGAVPTAWVWWEALGGALLVLGLAGAVVGARDLGGALTAMPEPVPGNELVETGLFALVRHPIYGALTVVAIGASLLFASWPAGLLSVVILVFFWAKSSYEERRLRIVYPRYSAYRARVRRRLLPFLL